MGDEGKGRKRWWEEQGEYDMTVEGTETASSCWLTWLAEKVGDPRAGTHPFLGKEVEWEEELAWTPMALSTAGRCLSDLTMSSAHPAQDWREEQAQEAGRPGSSPGSSTCHLCTPGHVTQAGSAPFPPLQVRSVSPGWQSSREDGDGPSLVKRGLLGEVGYDRHSPSSAQRRLSGRPAPP